MYTAQFVCCIYDYWIVLKLLTVPTTVFHRTRYTLYIIHVIL